MSSSDDSLQNIPLNGIQSSLTKAPKFGTMIPNRIFVGGITGNTTEAELRQFFSTFGAIKDCKIIADRAGVSRGYGFVTFVQLEDAEKLVQKEGEQHLIFKDRKLNIGPAVRKQQAQTVSAVSQYPQLLELSNPGTIVYANGLPYVLQNGLTTYQVPEGFGVPAGASPMVPPSYPFILPQSGYYPTPTAGATAAAATYQLTGGTMPTQAWPFASGNIAMPVVSGSHVPMAAAGQVAVGSGSTLDQYLYQVPTMFSGPDVGSAHSAGLHYQRVDVGQLPVIDPIANEGSLIAESGIASVHRHHHPHHPYVDVHHHLAASALGAHSATAAMFTAPASKDNGNILLTSSIQNPTAQNYGIKRVFSVPPEILQSPSNSYSLYGLPPLKFFAGQDRQRIIAQAVGGNSEIQLVPKTQS